MKKLSFIFFAVCLLFVSCATTVGFDTLIPAEVNIGGNSVIAVSSTIPYRYYSRSEYYRNETAYYAGKTVEKALGQGLYPVMGIKNTDAVINAAKTLSLDPTEQLLKAGAKILVQSSIADMDCYNYYTEEVHVGKDGHKDVYVYVDRNANLALSVTVWNLETKTVIDRFILEDSRSSDSERAYIKSYDDDGVMVKHPDRGAEAMDLYESILDSFGKKIRNRLVPHYEYVKLVLIKDKKNDVVSYACDLADEGEYRKALDVFENDWNKNRNTVSGCNMAIINYSLGNRKEAIDQVQEVYDSTGNPQAYEILCNLKELYSDYTNALSQTKTKENVTVQPVIQY